MGVRISEYPAFPPTPYQPIIVPRALSIFRFLAIFIGIPSGSLCQVPCVEAFIRQYFYAEVECGWKKKKITPPVPQFEDTVVSCLY